VARYAAVDPDDAAWAKDASGLLVRGGWVPGGARDARLGAQRAREPGVIADDWAARPAFARLDQGACRRRVERAAGRGAISSEAISAADSADINRVEGRVARLDDRVQLGRSQLRHTRPFAADPCCTHRRLSGRHWPE